MKKTKLSLMEEVEDAPKAQVFNNDVQEIGDLPVLFFDQQQSENNHLVLSSYGNQIILEPTNTSASASKASTITVDSDLDIDLSSKEEH